MKLYISRLAFCLSTVAIVTLYGCGGGGETVASGGSITAPPVVASSTINGAALANAVVTITDSTGTSPCEQDTITTTALGSYSCTLKAGKSAPFFVVVTDPTGNTPPLVSIQSTTPAAGDNLTVNVTPLTTAIVAQLSTTGNALSIVASGTVDAAALKSITANVVAQLANILASIGAPADYDPFTTSITAATASGTGNTADLILDVVRIVNDPISGAPSFSTVDNPTPILLATATTTGTVAPILTDGVSTLSQATQIAAQAFTNCLAVPKAQRVLTVDSSLTQAQGGPEILDIAPQCQNIVATTSNGAGVTFLHNGYRAGQFFYGLLNDDLSTGAQFSVPEIMLFQPADTTAVSPSLARFDRALLNIKFIDSAGNPGNLITVAARLTGTSTTTRPTDWWLVGNQQAVDTTVRLNIRRVEQLNSANTQTFRMSTYQTGIQFNINAKGPGSVSSGGALLNIARVTGPRLPTAGLVYKRSSGAQSSMDLFNKAGSLTGGSQCGNGVTASCPNIWLARTNGLTGLNATTLAANPNIIVWAQPGEGFDATKIVKGARYRIELFYGSNVGTADRTVFKTLLSDLVIAEQGFNLPWNSLGPKSLAALDPNGSLAGTQINTLALDWVQNPSAQQIGGITGVIDNFGTFGPSRFVPRGALSGILDNQTIPSFTTSTPRTLIYGYRMLDSSGKQSVYQYN